MNELNKKTSKQEDGELLTINEVLARLKISRTTLHELTVSGKIKKYKVGESVRYKSNDVNELIVPAIPAKISA